MGKRGVPFHSSNSWHISFWCAGVGSFEQPSISYDVLPLNSRNQILSVKTYTKEDLPAIGMETCTQMWDSDPNLQFGMCLLFYPNQTHMSCTSCPNYYPFFLGHRQHLPRAGICILDWVNVEIFFLSVNLLINIKMKSDLAFSVKCLTGLSSSTTAISYSLLLWVNVGWTYLNDNLYHIILELLTFHSHSLDASCKEEVVAWQIIFG